MKTTASPLQILTVIPARGGSKGIPKKNIRLLGGKPLIAHTIEASLGSRLITRTTVSTDDAEIGDVAKRYGSEVIWRPAEIAGDLSSSESALLHVLKHLLDSERFMPEILVFLQCTSPFTTAEDIDGTITALLDQGADTAFAATPFHYFLWKQAASGDCLGINHDKSVRPMRQQREPQFLETGAVYVMRTQGFLTHKHRFFGRTAMHIIPAERVLEIDEPADIDLAEARLMHQSNMQSRR